MAVIIDWNFSYVIFIIGPPAAIMTYDWSSLLALPPSHTIVYASWLTESVKLALESGTTLVATIHAWLSKHADMGQRVFFASEPVSVCVC
jgi:hypothetical protein